MLASRFLKQIGDKLTSRYEGICKALYMLPMNLSKDVALEWIAKEGTWEKLKVTEKCNSIDNPLFLFHSALFLNTCLRKCPTTSNRRPSPSHITGMLTQRKLV
eukprot:Rhum_TRINITY_DN11082_c0_g1::Rhum_TRINITY_DN11082_c0_g1_i1::g.42261::m.42261